MRRVSILVIAATFALAPQVQGQVQGQAQDPNLGRDIVAGCAGCHGTNGVAQGGMPSLAGQSKVELVRKMQDFKAGRAPATVMSQLAKGYTDEQIELAAIYLAAQKMP